MITGEGRIDEQTAFGKTAMGVARRAQAAGIRCLAIGGPVTPEGRDALAAVGAQTAAPTTARSRSTRHAPRASRPSSAARASPRPRTLT